MVFFIQSRIVEKVGVSVCPPAEEPRPEGTEESALLLVSAHCVEERRRTLCGGN